MLAAAGAAGQSLLRPEPDLDPAALVTPEIAGAGMVLRELVPIALTVAGLSPLLDPQHWSTSRG